MEIGILILIAIFLWAAYGFYDEAKTEENSLLTLRQFLDYPPNKVTWTFGGPKLSGRFRSRKVSFQIARDYPAGWPPKYNVAIALSCSAPVSFRAKHKSLLGLGRNVHVDDAEFDKKFAISAMSGSESLLTKWLRESEGLKIIELLLSWPQSKLILDEGNTARDLRLEFKSFGSPKLNLPGISDTLKAMEFLARSLEGLGSGRLHD